MVVSLILVLFMASTLLMPYANYNDTQSLAKVYQNCLSEDPDMDFAEFLVEKLFISIPEQEENVPTQQKPASMPLSVQIQQGVLIQVPIQQFVIGTTIVQNQTFFTHNHNDQMYGYRNMVFRPPLV